MTAVERLTEALGAQPDVELAVLIGSEARGQAGRRSDLDLAVLGPAPDRLAPLAVTLSRAAGRDVDLVDVRSAPPLLRFEVARDGRLLVERHPFLWSDIRAKAMVDWWDWAPYARRIAQAAAARLRAGTARVRPEVAGTRIARASAWLDDASRVFELDADTFIASSKDRDLAIFYLFLALQECVDLAAHWVADAGWGAPDDVASLFDVLAERSAIEKPLADTLRQGVGLRNRIAHGYAMLDYRRVRLEALAGIPNLRVFLAAVGQEAGL
jgi:hypothetical protein